MQGAPDSIATEGYYEEDIDFAPQNGYGDQDEYVEEYYEEDYEEGRPKKAKAQKERSVILARKVKYLSQCRGLIRLSSPYLTMLWFFCNKEALTIRSSFLYLQKEQRAH